MLLCRVAGADARADFRQLNAPADGFVLNAVQRNIEIPVNIVVERLQRRYVKDTNAGRSVITRELFFNEPVDAPEAGLVFRRFRQTRIEREDGIPS